MKKNLMQSGPMDRLVSKSIAHQEFDRSTNQLRWVGSNKLRYTQNSGKGTRQTTSVTSEEASPIQNIGILKLGVATV